MHVSMSQCEKGAVVQAITFHHTHIWVHTHTHTHGENKTHSLRVSELFCGSPGGEMPLFLGVEVIVNGGETTTFLIVMIICMAFPPTATLQPRQSGDTCIAAAK